MTRSSLSVFFLAASTLAIFTMFHWEEIQPLCNGVLRFLGSSPSELARGPAWVAHGSALAAVQKLAAWLRSEELTFVLDDQSAAQEDASSLAKKLKFHVAEQRLQTEAEKAESWLRTMQLERQNLRKRKRAASSAASALTQLGSFQAEHGRPNTAVLGLQRAVKIMKVVVVEDDSDPQTDNGSVTDDKGSDLVIAAKAEATLADALCAAGGEKGERLTQAKALFEEALQTLNRVDPKGHSGEESSKALSAKVHASLAHCLHLNGDLSTAAAMLRVASVLANETKGHHLIPKLARLWGGIRHDEGSTEEAINMYDQYLDNLSKPQGSAGDGPTGFVEAFETLQDHALASASLGHRTEALRLLSDVQGLQERLQTELGRRQNRSASSKEKDSPDLALLASIARTWQLRAEILLNDDDTMKGDQSHLREAVAASSHALPILKKLRDNGEGLRQLSDALNTHGNALMRVRRPAEAEAAYAQALDLSKELHGSVNPLTAAMLHNVGTAVARQGDNRRALQLLNEALSILKQTLGDNPDVSAALASIASIYRKQGETQKSLSTMQEAVHIAEKTLPAGHSARKHYETILELWEDEQLNNVRRGQVDSIIET